VTPSLITPYTEPQPRSPTEGMIVAQGGDVLLGMAASVDPIAAVMVRLSPSNKGDSAAVMVKLSLVPVIMASSVGLISAVKVRLSLGHGHSIKGQVEVAVTEGGGVGVVVISKVAPGIGDAIPTYAAGPQETKNNRIRPVGNNRKILGNILFMVPCLFGG
jgi:hypothetical protein